MFDIRSLGTLAFSGGFTMWHYATEDHFPTILAPGYFNDIRRTPPYPYVKGVPRAGDVMIVSSTRHGVSVVKSVYVERSDTVGVVVRLMSSGRLFHHDQSLVGADVTIQPALAPPCAV